jgi:hypothetical protein
MRRIVPAVLALSVVLFVGCKAREIAEKANIAKDLEKRGTLDLMKEVSKDSYDPPKDGKLTDAQIQMYLKVRKHEKDIAQVALKKADEHAKAADAAKSSLAGVMESFNTMKAAAQFATADIRAAKDLGYNTQEYLWVKGQIMAVSMTSFAETATGALDVAYQQTKKAYDEAKDEQTKQMYKQMLDGYDQSRKEGKEATANQDPALVYNRELVKKYDNELTAFATEMSKYEQKEGDSKRTMEQLQQSVKKLADEAKTGTQ